MYANTNIKNQHNPRTWADAYLTYNWVDDFKFMEAPIRCFRARATHQPN